jgi:hypothetical protein
MPPRWPAGLHRAAGGTPNVGGRPYAIPRPGMETYLSTMRTNLTDNQRQTTIGAGGAATIQLGPQGQGTRWYLTQANVWTTTGALDSSTVALYLGAQVQGNLLGGQSFSGGGDTIGLNVRPLVPGDLIIAVWAGGHPGDIASLILYGDQDVLN